MASLFDINVFGLFGQLLIGLINGSFYALLSLGLAIIFGLLKIINFAQGALYMLGAFMAWMVLQYFGINYWAALFIVPLAVGLIGVIMERFLLRRISNEDHLYSLLLTFGIALILQGVFTHIFGSSGLSYKIPAELKGGFKLPFMYLPTYRAWIIVVSVLVCGLTWYMIEKTKLGAYLRAGTENPKLMQAFGINVPLIVTLTFGFGVGLAGLGGVLAAPIYSVSPYMGADLLIVVFAIVVIGGMGSIGGAILTGLAMGILEGLTKYFYPEASTTIIFVVMVIVLLLKPSGLFGKEA
ncbi:MULTISPECIES: branched-chain amino acid ABC transporter permease [unclassified Marinobacterium]|uniref:branched-chain amino acid ABC transporter permease n=1 Tax=unclassified Marinobacterium TaxID=2644139 RepID=UPI0015684180|nr:MULTISPECIES: branched-chain amino acid ABC transporter permease [unclassified Marinobacterium]NRP10657.1 High-affinity branched-chain amino acid transport system permease protein LivH [Marinobacterium sp. xm-g-48]NRP46777.1 High-affinity branched-chain amino acid transport system permease protein LivH [Marinobacterium sp. xm-d-543]NRP83639.1 High-affinity branched-chain amino acid transport system permease protein LivH [Marinobacterium sp. xm-d-509]NRQ23334.1 High-affinity branched-chain am